MHFMQASAFIDIMSLVDVKSPTGYYLPYMSFQGQMEVEINALKASIFDNLLISVFDKSSIVLSDSEISNANNRHAA